MKTAEQFVNDPFSVHLSPEQLATVPTSILLHDVINHDCDLYHASSCDRCAAKLDEIDRRLPPRSS